MKPQTECDEEQGADNGELEERYHHIREHDDVDPEKGELAHVREQVEPRDRDGDRSDLPLPAEPQAGLCVALGEVDHKDDGGDVAGPLQHVLDANVSQASLDKCKITRKRE